ncbi:MAG: Hsp20/alpha crystallin family protein [Bauldia sp.]|nr:Hsp20/alpha crystallin family protein [Bauldia sp.]
MAEAATKMPVKNEAKEAVPVRGALDSLRQEIDRLFEDFPSGLLRSPFRRPLFEAEPFWRREWSLGAIPAVDIVEKDKAYEVSAELPGMDEKNIEVKYADGLLTIKGEKEETKEEKKKDYHLSERRYGSFQRAFGVPDGVDADRIVATFNKGVLTVTLPKSAEAQKKEKTIAVTAK